MNAVAGWSMAIGFVAYMIGFLVLIWMYERTNKELYREFRLKRQPIVRPVMPRCED